MPLYIRGVVLDRCLQRSDIRNSSPGRGYHIAQEHMIQVRGVHPLDAAEPVHLIDVAIQGSFDEVDWAALTQPIPGHDQADWQAAYDEQELPALPDGRSRAAFFFHYLDTTAPLEYAGRPIVLPVATPVPPDLAAIEYYEP